MSPTEVPAAVAAVVGRLARVDPANPPLDRAAVEHALGRHFAALRLDPRPVRWMPDLASAYAAAEGRAWDPEWSVAEARAWLGARDALTLPGDTAWELGMTPLEPAARAAVRKAAWRREDARVPAAGWPVRAVRMPGRAEESAPVLVTMPPEGGASRNPLASAWETGRRGAALAPRLGRDGAAESRATRYEPWRPHRFELLTGASAAGEAAVWMAAPAAAESSARAEVRRMAEIWTPLLDAFEAGLWLFFMFAEETLALPRPAVRLQGDRFHAEDGPALAWPGGTRRWFWKGVEVPQYVVEEPSRITPRAILDERNAELRRVLLERHGAERFLRALGAEPVHADDFGTLYRVEFPGDEPLVMVKVLNSTPELDGSRREYFLRVPPNVETAHEAVAWTFGLSAAEYHPDSEA